MTRHTHRLIALIAAIFMMMAMTARPALAQSILRDAETEALFRDISDPLVEAAGMRPGNVEFVLLSDQSINAFVAGGQRVYIHSGLIMEADHVGQLQAVIAHELGHVEGGHIIRLQDGFGQAGAITIASLILGGLAIAAGAGEAGLGAMALGQQVATSQFLAFSRTQETSADMAGARYLKEAGISGRGFIEFFQKLQNQEYRLNIRQDNGYARTHPMNRDRIASLSNQLMIDPAWNRPNDPELERRFQRVKAKLIGYINPARATRDYGAEDQSVPAITARAYAYHRGGYPDQALRETTKLVTMMPDDPYMLELHGQVLLESGFPMDALEPLRRAAEIAPDEPLIASTFGHALIATEDTSYYPEAKQILRAAVARDRTNAFAWYQLGVIYSYEGDEARAALASAERFHLTGQHQMARISARRAMAGIEAASPDHIRAQDILLVSEHELRKAGEDID
ncbi:M48 family metalloprotease [Sphingomicrobium sediminis]|uniref:M48 family metalloprotease n=1 Tax=Sphingomicrobium sediminis TaxID=2950949 RepID=A0A9X2J3L8_9SPHN|nr:M48 family metalloprotease [Sphingomicrobium sediminis]MCM8557441.1 M48 family metalloprotease [Sphingomicrobium sediminis]